MKRKNNKSLKTKAQQLRKNATKQERHLWYDFLATYPIRFRRQVTVDHYIIDFYCAQAKLAIELDGSQHYTEEGAEQDQARTAQLNQYDVSVLRFSNLDIDRNFEGVCAVIDQAVRARV